MVVDIDISDENELTFYKRLTLRILRKIESYENGECNVNDLEYAIRGISKAMGCPEGEAFAMSLDAIYEDDISSDEDKKKTIKDLMSEFKLQLYKDLEEDD